MRNLKLVLLALIMVVTPMAIFSKTAQAQVDPASLNSALVDGWDFEEGSGTTATGSQGQELNLINMDNTNWVAGVPTCSGSRALSFDGSEIADGGSNISKFETSAVTISAWVKPDFSSGSTVRTFVSYGGLTEGPVGNMILYVNDDSYYGVNQTYYQITHDQFTRPADGWIHITSTYDNITGLGAVYMHDTAGNLLTSVSTTTGGDLVYSYMGEYRLSIGGIYNLGSGILNDAQFYAGLIDNVRYFDRGVSQDEAAYLASTEACPSASQSGGTTVVTSPAKSTATTNTLPDTGQSQFALTISALLAITTSLYLYLARI